MRAFWRSKTPDCDRPTDCSLCLCIPLTRDDFLAAAANEPGQGFVRGWVEQAWEAPPETLWERYSPIAAYAGELAAEAESAKVRVFRNATFQDFLTCLAGERRVTTLIAHWYGNGVQFSRDFVPATELVGHIPPGFTGTLDLTACYSAVRLLDRIKKQAPRATVIAVKREALPSVRLAIYRQTLKLLQQRRYTFAEAMRQVHLTALERL